MIKARYFILLLLIILLGISYYNQDIPTARVKKASAANNELSSNPVKDRGTGKKIKDTVEKLPEIFPYNFEDILKGSDTSDNSNAVTDSNAQAAANVVVGNRGSQDILIRTEGSENNRTAGSAELDALREAAELFNSSSRGSSLIPGFKASTPISIDDPAPAVIPTAVATARPNELSEVTGQARGYTMLYLMHPKARQTSEKQLEAMIRSKVQQLYLGVLVDGTFGKDIAYLTNVVRRINREKRSLVLVLYLTNGPTMRNFSQQTVDAPFNTIDPVLFRILIRTDNTIQATYQNIIRPIVPVLQLNKRLNESNRNYVSVMLEDNLDDASYLSMKSQAAEIIGNRATFIRNPCGGDGCPEGSTQDGLGDPVESHMLEELPLLQIQDGFSLDGTGYRLPDETDERIPSYSEVKDAAFTSVNRGIKYFGLWRFERQGNKLGEPVLPVNDRTFEVPSEADILNEIELLRAGLTQVE